MNKNNKKEQENILATLAFNIIIPAIVLSKFSKPDHLGSVYALIIALAFPLSYGLYSFYKTKKTNMISVLGFVSVLLTGTIGLLKLSAEWIAVKEAAIPFIIGVAVLISIKTKYPLVKTFLYNDKIFDIEKINRKLEENNNVYALEKKLQLSSVFLSFSFFLSSFLNYALAEIIIKSPTGTVAFNEELGKMTALSYPVIALPSTIVMFFVLWYVIHSLKTLSKLSLEEMYAAHLK